MRPRVFPAEDIAEEQAIDGRGSASMRPRVFPAEDVERNGCILLVEQLQ